MVPVGDNVNARGMLRVLRHFDSRAWTTRSSFITRSGDLEQVYFGLSRISFRLWNSITFPSCNGFLARCDIFCASLLVFVFRLKLAGIHSVLHFCQMLLNSIYLRASTTRR